MGVMVHSFGILLLGLVALSAEARLQGVLNNEAGSVRAHSDSGKKVQGTIFSYLVKEWKEIPDQAAFVKQCSKTVSEVLPSLHQEYTARQVPKILFHECDVYATKDTFKTENGTLKDALSTCRYCAGRLGAEFMDEKPDYDAWCLDVHGFLSKEYNMEATEAERNKLVAEQRALKEQLESLRREHDVMTGKSKAMEAELGHMKGMKNGTLAECCPAGCRQC